MLNYPFIRIKYNTILLLIILFLTSFALHGILVNVSSQTSNENSLIANDLDLVLKKYQQHDVSLTFNLPNDTLEATFLELYVHDADSKSEGELWVNGVKGTDLFPNRVGGNDAKWSTQYVEFPAELLKNGKNTFTFKHVATGGFMIDRLRVVMIHNGHNIKAFPGAEGFGTDTIGGRGGRVFAVTSLKDSGPGSLREAIEASGPRIVVFHVGGTIVLKKPISIKNPYITIAGQTAPGNGIQIAHAGLNVRTHDVVIRGMRIRPGDIHKKSYDAIDPHGGDTPIRNLVIDHCSLSWAIDENIGFWNDVKDATVSWSIISEGLYDSYHYKDVPHSRGILVGDGIKNISIHHNLFAHNNRRNPELKSGSSTNFVNNLLYNWGKHAVLLVGNDEPLSANIIANHAIAGPNIADSSYSDHLIYIYKEMMQGSKFYVHGNLDPSRTKKQQDDWDSVYLYQQDPDRFRTNNPISTLQDDVTIHPVEKVKSIVLGNAGATAPNRDTVDERIVGDVQQKTGKIIDSQEEVGGWPTFQEILRTDSDQDGLPDDWEKAHAHLDQNNPNDALEDYNNNGYLNIEDYINSFFKDPA